MYKIVIIRHGLTQWSNKFTGWTDIDLAEEGIKNAFFYGKVLKEKGYEFDLGFTSYLKRGIKTLWTVLDAMDLNWIPVITAWQLNERHYGDLQGQNKSEAVLKYSKEQVELWRRSYDNPPPLLSLEDPRNPRHDKKYLLVEKNLLPVGESLKDTYNRSIPYWKTYIEPEIKKGRKIILSGHHNSLRAIIKYLDNISDSDITKVNIPYCIPLVYEFDKNLHPTNHYYLASDNEVARIIESIKNQTK